VNKSAGRLVIPEGIMIDVSAGETLKIVPSTIFVSPVGSKIDVREGFPSNIPVFNTVTCVADKSIKLKIEQDDKA
jgi:hypothetical protein